MYTEDSCFGLDLIVDEIKVSCLMVVLNADSPVGEKIGAKEGIGVGSCETGSGKNV